MTTLRMSQWILGLMLLGMAAALAAQAQGYFIDSRSSLGLHVVIALAAALTYVGGALWVMLFALGVSFVLKSGAHDAELVALQRRRTRILAALALLGVTLSLSTFMIGFWSYSDRVSVTTHHFLSWASCVAQILIWCSLWRGLDLLHGGIDELSRATLAEGRAD